jgi:glycosyltransferase involved in cell wall biosynthesis
MQSIIAYYMNSTFVSPLVTVVIPTFNRESILMSTIESIQNGMNNAMLIVVNDGGKPLEIGGDFIKVINVVKNIGESGAVNIGWENADTKYITIISDDDPQPLTWLRSITDFAVKNPGYVAYYPNTVIKKLRNREKIIYPGPYNSKTFKHFLSSPCLAGVLIDREYLNKKNLKNLRKQGVVYPNDLLQWLEISKYGDFLYSPDTYSNWWVHPDQLSQKIPRSDKCLLYYKNISNWQKENIDKSSLSIFFTITLLRSIQHLKLIDFLSIKTLRILFKMHLENFISIRISKKAMIYLVFKKAITLIFFKVSKW